MAEATSVKVALRCRPLVPSELSAGCVPALIVNDESGTVSLGSADKAFT